VFVFLFGEAYGFDMGLLDTKGYIPTHKFKDLDLPDELTELR